MYTRWLLCACLFCLSAPAGAQPYLKWQFDEGTVSNTYRLCNSVSVTWFDASGNRVWTRTLPERMRKVVRVVCGCQKADGSGPCTAELDFYNPKRGPRPPSSQVIDVLETQRAVVIGDVTGILALAKRDGAVLLDWRLPPRPGKSPFYFVDSGTFRFGRCRGEVRGGWFFTRCGSRLLYFNRADVAVVRARDLSLRALGRVKRVKSLGRMQFATTIPVGRETLRLRGVVYE